MNRPRHRRRDPQRTGPIRNIGKVLRDEDPWRDFERRDWDAASRGVREGYRVIDEQIRRGQRMARELDDHEPWSGGRYGRERRPRSWYEEDDGRRERRDRPSLLGMPLRHIGLLAREILRQAGSGRPDPWRLVELILRLQIELVSELARCGFGVLGGLYPRREDPFDEDAERVGRDVDESYGDLDEEEIWEEDEEDEPWDWPQAPSTPTLIRSTVPIPVYVSSHERTEIDLDLPAGSQSLDLEVESPRAAGASFAVIPEPAFEAEFIEISDGPAILLIEVPRELPAGRYLRRVLIRATREPVGDLTVQVGTIPPAAAPKTAAPKAAPKTPKTAPKGRKKR